MKVYIDQNILQYSSEEKISLNNSTNIQYVCSNEHFNEISRWHDEKIFKELDRLKPLMVNVELDSNNKLTDNAIFSTLESAVKSFEEYEKTIDDFKPIRDLISKTQVYTSGNKSVATPEELNNNFQKILSDLLSDIGEDLPSTITEQYKEKIKTVGNGLQNALDNNKEKILPLERYRKEINAQNLSSLSEEDGEIIDQIWKKIQHIAEGKNKDEFFKNYQGADLNNYTKTQNIFELHSLLNHLGYWPDRGITKISKIHGVNSDASHLANASYCDKFSTADFRLYKKGRAIFEFLKIQTDIELVEI